MGSTASLTASRGDSFLRKWNRAMHGGDLERRLVFQSCAARNEEFILYLRRERKQRGGWITPLIPPHASMRLLEMKHTMIPGKCALFLRLHTPDFLQDVDSIFLLSFIFGVTGQEVMLPSLFMIPGVTAAVKLVFLPLLCILQRKLMFI